MKSIQHSPVFLLYFCFLVLLPDVKPIGSERTIHNIIVLAKPHPPAPLFPIHPTLIAAGIIASPG